MISVPPRLQIRAPSPGPRPDTWDESRTDRLRQLNDNQHEYFLRPRSTIPSHILRIEFALDTPGWDASAIDTFSATLTEYADTFSLSKLDNGACSLRQFDIKAPPETQLIQSRSYRLNPVLSKQADAIMLDSYIAAGLIQHSTTP